MRRVVAILVLVGMLTGCAGSEDTTTTGTTPTETVVSTGSTTTETPPDVGTDAPPRTFDEAMARLPPFDVPPSPEVAAYREAVIGGFFERCVPGKGGADEVAFVRANRKLLDRVGVFPGARFVSEFVADAHENNGCLEGMGPATSYTTDRNYRLPDGAKGPDVVRYYGRRLPGWTQAFAPGGCEQTFTRGGALLYVRACPQQQGSQVVTGPLRLSARALKSVTVPDPPKLPLRPFGAQYPVATGYLESPEPTGYEVEPGTSCERISGGDVPSIIIPPAPGIRAELRNEPLKLGAGSFPQHVLVEWSFEQILGDCPPTELHLTLVNPNETMPPLSLPFDVHASSGTERLPVLDSFRDVAVLRASAESVDGARSRSVAILIRR
jgi:hypothetical protein